MTRPLDPNSLAKLLQDLPTESTDYQTYQFSHGKTSLTIREPLWKEYAIGIKLLTDDDNPFIACMAMLPMLLVDFNGSPAIDIAQIGSLPKEVFAPLMRQLTQFFQDISISVGGDEPSATEDGLSDQRADIPKLAPLPSNDSGRVVKSRRSAQRGTG